MEKTRKNIIKYFEKRNNKDIFKKKSEYRVDFEPGKVDGGY